MGDRTVKKEARADFSRTCEGCGKLENEPEGRGETWTKCMAPGWCRGRVVAKDGVFLPYVPAWCPLQTVRRI